MQPKILIFGFGYTATCLANILDNLDFHVIGTSRNQEKRDSSRYTLIDFNEQDVAKHLAGGPHSSVTHILITTPPSALMGDPVLATFVELIKKQQQSYQWLGYLSSTGVYGDHQGGWVSESSPSLLPGPQGLLRLAAEDAWLSLAKAQQLPLHIFRIAGIYGPYRNALTRIKNGKDKSVYKQHHFFSRIHVDDIAATLLASMQNPNPLAIYNVADDKPSPAHEVDEYAAHLLHLPAPERVLIENACLSPMAHEFYRQNRRVNNEKIKKENRKEGKMKEERKKK